MDNYKRKRLEERGWKFGSADEFLDLSKKEKPISLLAKFIMWVKGKLK
jgi:hypothetical protein